LAPLPERQFPYSFIYIPFRTSEPGTLHLGLLLLVVIGRMLWDRVRGNYPISHQRSSQRCAAIIPAGMKHLQNDPRRSLRQPAYCVRGTADFGAGASDGTTSSKTLYHFAVQIRPKMPRYFPRQRDETYAERSGEVVASAGRRTGQPPRRSNAEKAPRPDSTRSKQNLSRLAGSGGSVLRIGITISSGRERSRCARPRRVRVVRATR